MGPEGRSQGRSCDIFGSFTTILQSVHSLTICSVLASWSKMYGVGVGEK